MDELLVIVGMFVLRLGVPLAITLAVGYGLHRLDARWEAEARADRNRAELPVDVKALKKSERPCWEVKGCNEAQKAECPACRLLDIPCWVARLRTTGLLPFECQGCELFMLSPAA